MKNNIKAGDKFIIKTSSFDALHGPIYRDCTPDKEYTCLASGLAADVSGLYPPEGVDVSFRDDVGDRVLTHFDKLTKVGAGE